MLRILLPVLSNFAKSPQIEIKAKLLWAVCKQFPIWIVEVIVDWAGFLAYTRYYEDPSADFWAFSMAAINLFGFVLVIGESVILFEEFIKF